MDALAGSIRLDFRSQEPIYLQIVRQVEKLVQDGVLKPGDQLPTVRQMAIDLRINFSTVARAYHILDERKLISTQRGRGTYIWLEDGTASPPRVAPPRENDSGEAGRLESIAGRLESEAGRFESEADRYNGEQARHLAEDFIDQATAQGLTLEEIQAAFDQAMARRRQSA